MPQERRTPILEALSLDPSIPSVQYTCSLSKGCQDGMQALQTRSLQLRAYWTGALDSLKLLFDSHCLFQDGQSDKKKSRTRRVNRTFGALNKRRRLTGQLAN